MPCSTITTPLPAVDSAVTTAPVTTTPVTTTPVTTRALDPKTAWQGFLGETGRLPHFISEHYSQPADLRVLVLNYGERQPGAEDILLYLNRPVAGEQYFDTTNGAAFFSASGAYLLLTMPFLLIAIDAYTLQAWHYTLPDRTMLLSAGWSAECVVGQLVAYGKRTDEAEPLGPWTWGELTRTWPPGLGRAAAAPQKPAELEKLF